MKELISIIKQHVGTDEANTVNARDLHEGLKNKRQFADWIKQRISECDLTEGVDFIRASQFCETGMIGKIDYHLTLDAAKHLAMLERNDQGKLFRQYFIDFEKKAREVLPSQTFEEMTIAVLTGLQAKVLEQQATLEQQAPKVEFFENYVDASGLYNFTEAGKLLGVSATRLCAWLRNEGYLFQSKDYYGRYKNLPYQKFVDLKWFVVKTWTTPDGGTIRQTFITPKGFVEIEEIWRD